MKNKNLKGILYIILMCLVWMPQKSRGQQKFNKFYTLEEINTFYGTYHFSGHINDFAIDPLNEEIYVAGQSETPVYDMGYESKFGYIGKIDPSGNALWLKINTKNGIYSDYENAYKRIIVTSDNNLLALTGTFEKSGHGSGGSMIGGQFMMHKISKTGSMLIQKNYGIPLNTTLTVSQFSDGKSLIEADEMNNMDKSYVAAGEFIDNFGSATINKSRIFAVKTQTDLTPLWRQFYSFFPANSNIIESANCIYQASDKNYILTGYSDGEVFVMKVDQGNGNILWAHRYTLGGSTGESIVQDCSGNIIVSGSIGSNIMLLSVDLSGNLLWIDKFDEIGTGMTLLKDLSTSSISMGGIMNPGNGDEHTFLLKFTPKNCSGYMMNTYGDYIKYKTNVYEFSYSHYKKMLQKPGSGYMFLNDYPVSGSLTYPNYRFNLVSTDNLFFSSNGIPGQGEYCVPVTQTPVHNLVTASITNINNNVNALFSQAFELELVIARLTDYVYCADCGETLNETVNFEFCNLQESTPGKWYQPCQSLNPGEKYTYDNYDSEIGYDDANGNHISGCISFFLTPGAHYFNFYNAAGCLTKRITVNVTVVSPSLGSTLPDLTLSYCQTPGTNGRWITPCDYFTLPLDFEFTVTGVTSPYLFQSKDWIATHGGNGCIAIFVEDGTYEIKMYDKELCKYISRLIHIVPNTPTLVILPDLNLSFCPFPGVTGRWIEPCKLSDFMPNPSDFMYTFKNLTSGSAEFNSDDWVAANGGDGCIALFMDPGTYEINFYDKTTCTQKRLKVNVTANTLTTLASETIDLYYCPMDGNTGKWVNPCDYFGTLPADFTYTALDQQVPPRGPEFNSEDWKNTHPGSNGCIALFMESGTYHVDFFDKTTCTFKTYIFNIIPIDLTYCDRTVEVPCGQTFNLETLELGGCANCNHTAGVTRTPWVVTTPTLPEGSYLATCQFIDEANCKICEWRIHIVKVQTLPVVYISKLSNEPGCMDVNLNTIMPCLAQRQAGAQILHYTNQPGNVPVFLPGDVYKFCCSPYAHTFEVVLNNGCICRVKVYKTCGEGTPPPPPAQENPAGKMENGENAIHIFPNPSSGVYHIQYLDYSNLTHVQNQYTIDIMEITGKVVYTKTGLQVNNQESFDLSQFAGGIYTIKITMGEITQFVKLIKN